MLRSSQPLVGIWGRSCPGDERICTSAGGGHLQIFDCRSRRAAIAQTYLRGGGTEDWRPAGYGVAAYRTLDLATAAAQQAAYEQLARLCMAAPDRTLRNIRLIHAIVSAEWFQQVPAAAAAARAERRRNILAL